MSEPYVGEIRMFAGNFAPRGWAFCDGQLLAVTQNDALFSLLGTLYGGDGRTNFGLPDMRGRLPIHKGQGGGLSNHNIGQKFGSENETLTINQLPSHTHSLMASIDEANASDPSNHVLATQTDGDKPYADATSDPSKFQQLAQQSIANNGGSQPHSNLMPSLCVNFIISLFGIYPPRH
ncbi:tail fiber protein [Pseudoalteromonas sp. YIC-656]|uniref:phage tail protein n=1 Tax=Pseudoalteromonas pernae TaxID=3118054 RepID=UPI00324212E3